MTIHPGQSCGLQVVFTPRATGPKSAALTIHAYAGTGSSGPTGPVLASTTVRASGTGG